MFLNYCFVGPLCFSAGFLSIVNNHLEGCQVPVCAINMISVHIGIINIHKV